MYVKFGIQSKFFLSFFLQRTLNFIHNKMKYQNVYLAKDRNNYCPVSRKKQVRYWRGGGRQSVSKCIRVTCYYTLNKLVLGFSFSRHSTQLARFQILLLCCKLNTGNTIINLCKQRPHVVFQQQRNVLYTYLAYVLVGNKVLSIYSLSPVPSVLGLLGYELYKLYYSQHNCPEKSHICLLAYSRQILDSSFQNFARGVQQTWIVTVKQ